MNTKQFLDQHSREAELRETFRNFDSLPIEEKIEIRELWSNAHKTWAHRKLVDVYGVPCDKKWCGCNNFSSLEIAGERE